jgi:formamidopyrimidine-DNA glycosylase
MPELAEVEYYRRQWDAGVRQTITRVHLHGEKRVFRGTSLALLRNLAGQRFSGSASNRCFSASQAAIGSACIWA